MQAEQKIWSNWSLRQQNYLTYPTFTEYFVIAKICRSSCGAPFLWGPLFGRTCWTCLNPPLGVLKWTAAGARGASGRRAVCRAAADIERDVDPVTRRHRHTAASGVSAPTDSTAPVIATAAQVTASPVPLSNADHSWQWLMSCDPRDPRDPWPIQYSTCTYSARMVNHFRWPM